MINVGLLGSGRLGHVIAGAIAQGKVPECRLVGVLGRSKERLFPMEEQYGCRACQSPEELLALEQLQQKVLRNLNKNAPNGGKEGTQP